MSMDKIAFSPPGPGVPFSLKSSVLSIFALGAGNIGIGLARGGGSVIV